MLNRSKVKGMIIGGAIGDALGRPTESMTPEECRNNYPNGVRDYVEPKNNKWFKDEKFGVATDDTNLTIAVMESLIESDGFCMDSIAKYHVKAMQEDTEGWGPTTKESVKRFANGIHWSESGKTNEKYRGAGNGVPMKVSPIAAWMASKNQTPTELMSDKLIQFSAFTHYTRISAVGSVAHTNALCSLLNSSPERYNPLYDLIFVLDKYADANTREYSVEHLEELAGKPEGSYLEFKVRVLKLYEILQEKNQGVWTTEKVRSLFGRGNSYIASSLPVSYSFFLHNPFSIETLYDIVMYGGDTDTNAKFVGEMIGALNGIEIFQSSRYKHLLKFETYQFLLELTDKFCDKFKIK